MPDVFDEAATAEPRGDMFDQVAPAVVRKGDVFEQVAPTDIFDQMAGDGENKRADVATQLKREKNYRGLLDIEEALSSPTGPVGRALYTISQFRPDLMIKRIMGLPHEIERAAGWAPKDSTNPVDVPLLTPDQMKNIREATQSYPSQPQTEAPKLELIPHAAEVEKGAAEFLDELGSSMTTPGNVVPLAVGAKVPGAGVPVARTFEAGMVGELPAAVEQYVQARKSGDVKAQTKAALNVALAAGGSALIERSLAKMEAAGVQTSGQEGRGQAEEVSAPAPGIPEVGARVAPEPETPPPSAQGGVENARPGANGEDILEGKGPESAGMPPEAISVGPGAASPVAGEFDGGLSQLAQLTGVVREFIRPEQPIGDRLTFAQAASDAMTDGLDTASRWLGRVQAAGTALHDSLTKLPPFTDFKRTLGDWLGGNQKADLEAREFIKAVERQVPDKLKREAITNWIQADGDASVLQQRADLSRGSLKRGYEAALALTPEERILARNVSQYFDAKLREGMDGGLLSAGVENYVNQIWNRENPITKELKASVQVGRLTPDFKSARKRIFESYFAGEQAGFEPATKDVGRLVGIYDQSFNRSTLARAFLKQLTKAKGSDGRPLAAVTGQGAAVPSEAATSDAILIRPEAKAEAAADYKTINHPAMKGWRWAQETEEGTPIMVQGDLVVHPEIYTHLRNVLEGAGFSQYPVAKQIMRAQSVVKQTAFSLSPFHLVQEGVHGLGHQINPLRLEKLDLSRPEQMNMVKKGLQVASYDAWQDLQDGFFGGGPLVNKIPYVGKAQQHFTEWLFHDYIPRLKMTLALDAYDRNLGRYREELAQGKISQDQVAELTARQANAAFGELNYKHMGRNPYLRDAFRIFLVAPDFLEARGRFVGQAMKPYGGEQLKALGRIAVTSYVAARVLNKLLDDDYRWGWRDAFAVEHNGRRYTMRTVPSDIVELLEDGRRFAMNRGSFISHQLVEWATGRDYRGVRVDAKEKLKDALAQFVPMSLRPPKDDEKWWQAGLNASGLRNRPYTAETQMHKVAERWATDNKIQKPIEVLGDSPYRALRFALQDSDFDAARQEIQKLRQGGRQSADVDKAVEEWARSKFTGSPKTEMKFVGSLNDTDRRIYWQARRDREAVLARLRAVTGYAPKVAARR